MACGFKSAAKGLPDLAGLRACGMARAEAGRGTDKGLWDSRGQGPVGPTRASEADKRLWDGVGLWASGPVGLWACGPPRLWGGSGLPDLAGLRASEADNGLWPRDGQGPPRPTRACGIAAAKGLWDGAGRGRLPPRSGGPPRPTSACGASGPSRTTASGHVGRGDLAGLRACGMARAEAGRGTATGLWASAPVGPTSACGIAAATGLRASEADNGLWGLWDGSGRGGPRDGQGPVGQGPVGQGPVGWRGPRRADNGLWACGFKSAAKGLPDLAGLRASEADKRLWDSRGQGPVGRRLPPRLWGCSGLPDLAGLRGRQRPLGWRAEACRRSRPRACGPLGWLWAEGRPRASEADKRLWGLWA